MQFSDKAIRLASLGAKIARLQRLISERPDDEKLFIALSGLTKRAEMARSALSDVAARSSLEVLDYRIVQAEDLYPVKSVTESLSYFQSSITALHDAVVSGPKTKARYGQRVIIESTLNFELFYPGSKGFILSVESGRNLFGGSLDKTSDALNDFLSIHSTDGARDATRALGLAAVSTLFKWVNANTRWRNSVDYEWKARLDHESGRHVAYEHFQLLEELFMSAEEVESHPIDLDGVLVGLDVRQRSFHFAVPDGEAYKGRLHSDYIGGEKIIPHTYRARLMEKIVRKPATGEEVTSYELLELQ